MLKWLHFHFMFEVRASRRWQNITAENTNQLLFAVVINTATAAATAEDLKDAILNCIFGDKQIVHLETNFSYTTPSKHVKMFISRNAVRNVLFCERIFFSSSLEISLPHGMHRTDYVFCFNIEPLEYSYN